MKHSHLLLLWYHQSNNQTLANKSSKESDERVHLLKDQHLIFDIVNGYTGYDDAVTCSNTCNWLVYLSIYNSLLLSGGADKFLDQAERSKFTLAEYVAARFSGFKNLDEYQEFDALARAFFASFSQNLNMILPDDEYVREFVFALEDKVEIWERAVDNHESEYEA